MSERDIVFVLGSGRSGSSAITRALSLCGCALPQKLVGAEPGNPKGLWEPIEAIRINAEFVGKYGGCIGDPVTLCDDPVTADDGVRERYIERIQRFINECPKTRVLVIKEPMINELTHYWYTAARKSGLNVKVILCVRHPEEYALSAGVLGSTNTDVAQSTRLRMSLVWMKLNLVAERHSRDVPRVFVEYPNLINDWRVELRRVSEVLSISLDVDNAAVDAFLTPDLYRQRFRGAVSAVLANPLICNTYSILSDAARDASVDVRALDDLYETYGSYMTTLRSLFESYNREETFRSLLDYYNSRPVWECGRDC